MDGYVSKPIIVDDLVSEIARLTANGRAASPSRASSSGMNQASQIFDYDAALARTGDDLELLKELAQIFIDECPLRLAEMRAALANADLTSLQRAAHKLKGEAGTFNCALLVDAAVKIEGAAHAGQRKEAAEIFDGLESTAGRFTSALRLRLLEQAD